MTSYFTPIISDVWTTWVNCTTTGSSTSPIWYNWATSSSTTSCSITNTTCWSSWIEIADQHGRQYAVPVQFTPPPLITPEQARLQQAQRDQWQKEQKEREERT